MHVWRSLSNEGLHVTSGVYGSIFYTLTVFHALHVAVGPPRALGGARARACGGSYTEHSYVPFACAAMFWHFVDAVWVLMFVTLYLL